MFHKAYYPGGLRRVNLGIRSINKASVLSVHALTSKLPKNKNLNKIIDTNKTRKLQRITVLNIHSILQLNKIFEKTSRELHKGLLQKTLVLQNRTIPKESYHNSPLPNIPSYKSAASQLNQDQNELSEMTEMPEIPKEASLLKMSMPKGPNPFFQSEELFSLLKPNQLKISSLLTQLAIDKLPKRKIESQEDMINVFNTIMNGDPLKLSTPADKIRIVNENTDILLPVAEVKKKSQDIIDKLRKTVLDQKEINYEKFIEISYNLKHEFPKNPMIKSIILRSSSQYNRMLFYKVPEDRLSEVIDIILLEIILKK